MQTPSTWVQPVLLASTVVFLIAGILVSVLWYRREKRIRRGLQRIIEAEGVMGVGEQPLTAARDVESALKNLFESRSTELTRLRQMESYRRDYVGNVAHELKTPLFSIQGYLDAVLDDPEMELDMRKKFLSKAMKNSNRLGQIVKDLDAITKIESGVMKPDFQPFDLLALVRDVVESLELQANEKQISMSVTAPGSFFWVDADPALIRQVVTNLGINSIKYGKVQGQTRFKLSPIGERIIMEVADNGIGIPSQHVKRIFERYYRVDSDRSRASGGSGLGLSICKHIVEAHGEQIQVLSTEGAGSTFSFKLKMMSNSDGGQGLD
jgi:two-component system phosphate regulon sensor histidine kinase PhoR